MGSEIFSKHPNIFLPLFIRPFFLKFSSSIFPASSISAHVAHSVIKTQSRKSLPPMMAKDFCTQILWIHILQFNRDHHQRISFRGASAFRYNSTSFPSGNREDVPHFFLLLTAHGRSVPSA